MKDILHFEPLTPSKYQKYIAVGTIAYNQHYKHLWPSGNSAPYIQSSFTEAVLKKEESDANTILYLIQLNGKIVGIFKITLNCKLDSFSKNKALCIEKIYVLNAYAGKGIGKKVLQFAELRAQEMNKEIVWLDTMQKGPALKFYLQNGYEIHDESKVHFPTVIEDESLMWIMKKVVG